MANSIEYSFSEVIGLSISFDLPEFLKGPYTTQSVKDDDKNWYFLLQRRFGSSLIPIGKLEPKDTRTYKLTLNEKATEKDVKYFQDLLEELSKKFDESKTLTGNNIPLSVRMR